jgi:hypothetical protein
MAIKTDDCDIRDVRFYMDHGGNGDYYFNLVEYEDGICVKSVNMRFAMSGGNAPHEIKMAVANLFKLMEAAGLNNHPKEDVKEASKETDNGFSGKHIGYMVYDKENQDFRIDPVDDEEDIYDAVRHKRERDESDSETEKK